MLEMEKRKSIRKYEERLIPEADLEKILEAGRIAPSAKNKQPWEMVVVQNKDLQKKVAEAVKEMIGHDNPTSNALSSASHLIFVYNTLENDVWNLISLGACIENMILEATHLGYGSLWVGYVNNVTKDVNAIIEHEGELISCVCLGYKNEEPPARPRKELTEYVTYRKE